MNVTFGTTVQEPYTRNDCTVISQADVGKLCKDQCVYLLGMRWTLFRTKTGPRDESDSQEEESSYLDCYGLGWNLAESAVSAPGMDRHNVDTILGGF
jgi:hypothetical protein